MTQPIRMFAAIRPDEFARLYDGATQEALGDLGDLVIGAAENDRVPVPPNVADSFDVLITSWSTQPFDPAILTGSRLKLAVHSAGSVRGLYPADVLTTGLRLVQGGAEAMAVAVAEMSVTMTLALLRNLVLHDRRFQSSRDWRTGGVGILGRSITAQRIGLVSLSRVGRHYARMVQGLGATELRAYDPYISAADATALGVQLCDLDELCETSDVLAINAPATAQTAGMIGAEQLALLRDDAIVINTARARVTDEHALLAELRSGRLRAGLDVFTQEPLDPQSELFGLENVVLTPHVAGGTVEARFAQGQIVMEEIRQFLTDGSLQHEVTAENYHRLG
ncbi:hydroxyacid dehydrogenase [Ruania halotolerans]|uniref:hydroxyacid dehydrogenase n=1 Tax=Ruania halotolerans TaxID=2897773 RepID=UPI001E3A75AC|nr:hydroxyacid dehydrogenase [Ruania halotolerans]UFU06887.1 hydroxyacid dehydrogenase [Ruania halotolerans]